MYESIATWRDLTDKHLYHPGDKFPFDGREIPEERLEQLVSGHNMAVMPVITLVAEPDGGKPVEEPEATAKPKRTRKKTA